MVRRPSEEAKARCVEREVREAGHRPLVERLRLRVELLAAALEDGRPDTASLEAERERDPGGSRSDDADVRLERRVGGNRPRVSEHRRRSPSGPAAARVTGRICLTTTVEASRSCHPCFVGLRAIVARSRTNQATRSRSTSRSPYPGSTIISNPATPTGSPSGSQRSAARPRPTAPPRSSPRRIRSARWPGEPWSQVQVATKYARLRAVATIASMPASRSLTSMTSGPGLVELDDRSREDRHADRGREDENRDEHRVDRVGDEAVGSVTVRACFGGGHGCGGRDRVRRGAAYFQRGSHVCRRTFYEGSNGVQRIAR